MTDEPSSHSRRAFFREAGVTGLAAAAAPLAAFDARTKAAAADGTPEQLHLTWGDDPSRCVFATWASPGQAVNPRVNIHDASGSRRVVHAVQGTYTDGLNGQTVFTYHAKIDGLRAGTTYRYSLTADNDSQKVPLSAEFTTAPSGYAPFRWTSYGDLSTPIVSWKLS